MNDILDEFKFAELRKQYGVSIDEVAELLNERLGGPLVSQSTEFTGPGSAKQGPVNAAEQGNGSELYMLVLGDIVERAQFGAQKYGHPLRTTAEVDFALNAYQEVLDLLIYFRGEIERIRKYRLLADGAFELLSNNFEIIVTDINDRKKLIAHWIKSYHELIPEDHKCVQGVCNEHAGVRLDNPDNIG